jgi:hypothetical protein
MLRVKFKKSLNERKKTGEIWRKLPDQKATKKYIYPTSRKNLPNLKGWFTGTLEESIEHKIVSFDFDDTLTYAPYDPKKEDFVYQGPHEDMIDKIRYYIENPEVTVYVVTSRIKSDSPDPYGDISVEEFLDKHDLKVDGIYYTNGKLKAETLKELGVTLHHDDDSEENVAANALGIQTVASDPYGLYDKY